MSWVAVTAHRARMRLQSQDTRALRRSTGVSMLFEANLLAAWMGGDPVVVPEELDLLLRLAELNPGLVARPPESKIGTVAASLLLRRARQEPVDAELRRLAGAKVKTPVARAVLATLQRVLDRRPVAARARAAGSFETETQFARVCESAPPPLPLLLALTPDHPLYGFVFPASIPLAVEALLAAGVEPTVEAIGSLVQTGGDLRPRDLVYHRQDVGVRRVYRDDPNEIPGFDAVELTASAVVVHHYMGVRWQAPVLLDDDVDAFRFLRHIDAGWQIVEQAATEERARLEAARQRLPTVHRVSIDPIHAVAVPESTRRAAERYGVDVEVVSHLEA